MAPLAGLTGMNTDPSIQYTDQGVLEAHANVGGVDESHSQIGDEYAPTYPAGYGSGYHGTAYGPEVDRSGQRGYSNRQSGVAIDQTPTSHESPYPTGVRQPDLETPGSYAADADAKRAQVKLLHGRDMGGVRKNVIRSPAGREIETHYTTDRYDAPNETQLAPNVPGQLRGSGGHLKDTTQGYGQLNNLDEFQRGHSIRRVQHDGIPWDRSIDYAPGHVFLGRHLHRTPPLTVDSPYGQVAGDTSTGQQVMEVRGYPTPYQPPSIPTVQPTGVSSQAEDVWAYLCQEPCIYRE